VRPLRPHQSNESTNEKKCWAEAGYLDIEDVAHRLNRASIEREYGDRFAKVESARLERYKDYSFLISWRWLSRTFE
jgi:hypothetical protein